MEKSKRRVMVCQGEDLSNNDHLDESIDVVYTFSKFSYKRGITITERTGQWLMTISTGT